VAQAPTVDVVGLKALMRDLAKASDDRAGVVANYMKDAGRRVANPVANVARTAMQIDTTEGRRGPHLTGNIRVSATRTGASIRMGSKSVPWAGWVEFGGKRQRPHFSERPYLKDGRYLFPAARSMAQSSAQLYSDAIAKAFDNFPWTNTSGAPHD
jgi:hypothetical protein